MSIDLLRRRLLQSMGAAAAALAAPTPAFAAASTRLAAGDGSRAPEARIGLLQTRALAVERTRPRADLARNLQHMLDWVERAQAVEAHDWLAFHDCPLTGWERWSAAEARRIAIDLEGDEVQRLARAARAHRCHLSFGALLRLPDWPGHVIDATVFLSRRGEVASVQWAALPAGGPLARAGVTSLAEVLDEYLERYGRTALLRVATTDIGQLCALPATADPALAPALARAGAEFVLRTHAGPPTPACLAGAASCARERIHGGFVNAAVTTDLPAFLDSPTGGGTALHGPDGATLAMAEDGGERCVAARLSLGSGRHA
ncbi:MAG: hypothetical protein MUF07_18290 [Steroidobacteraceae bacterium]|jgi:predicted amidohydrolase|nr:hypothetical protein [Steroidobacteraceae bacterium]